MEICNFFNGLYFAALLSRSQQRNSPCWDCMWYECGKYFRRKESWGNFACNQTLEGTNLVFGVFGGPVRHMYESLFQYESWNYTCIFKEEFSISLRRYEPNGTDMTLKDPASFTCYSQRFM